MATNTEKIVVQVVVKGQGRTEERRVGKECRTRRVSRSRKRKKQAREDIINTKH